MLLEGCHHLRSSEGLASSEILWGVGIIWGPVRGWHHLRSSEGLSSSLLRCSVISHLHKGWIQTEASVIPSYLGMPILWQKQKQMETLLFQKWCVPPKQKCIWHVNKKLMIHVFTVIQHFSRILQNNLNNRPLRVQFKDEWFCRSFSCINRPT